jgi:hypothetical protein
MDHPVEDIDLTGSTVAVVGRRAVFFYSVKPYSARVFEPIQSNLESIFGGRLQTDIGKMRAVRFFNGGKAMIGIFERVLYVIFPLLFVQVDGRLTRLTWDLVTGKRIFRERLETRM